MKIKTQSLYNFISFSVLTILAAAFVFMSSEAKQGAVEGLALAENTIIPSLLPLLIIFLTVMKSGAGQLVARLFGRLTVLLFNLPASASSAVIFGLVGGYPTGALITKELLKNDDIDRKQARRLLRFCFCGGCGFIITAVGAVTMNSVRLGAMLFASNVISSLVVGVVLSFTDRRIKYEPFSFCEPMKLGDALSSATSSAISSVLNITAYIIVFSALRSIITVPDFLLPIVEITNGVCDGTIAATELAAYLAFGGICIHFQLLPIISESGMKYCDFLLFRIISSLVSYGAMRLLLILFPIEQTVFSSGDERLVNLFSVNVTLSVLMIIGCFVLVLDISSRKGKLS